MALLINMSDRSQKPALLFLLSSAIHPPSVRLIRWMVVKKIEGHTDKACQHTETPSILDRRCVQTQLFVYWCRKRSRIVLRKCPSILSGSREELRKVILEDYSSAWQFAFIFYSLSVSLSDNQRYIPWKAECVSPHKFISFNFQFLLKD